MQKSPIQRLTQKREFSTVLREGRFYSDHLLVLRAMPNKLPVARFGFTVSRRVGTATVRNRVKRRLREAARQSNVQRGWEEVVSARKASAEADFHQLKASVVALMRRVGAVPPSAGQGNGAR
ncbi:MAG: ribonuclease P protein component [Chloroflexi bacterium]|nr:ribonuclease P protein component [Chloroflexota bacterium]